MAASMWTMNGPWGRMAGVLVLCTLMLSNEVMCQEPETSTLNPTTTRPPADISSAALTTETPATATQPPSDAAGPQNPDSAISTSDDVESEKSSAIPTAATSAPADEVDDGNVSKTSATGESQAAQSSGSGSPVFVGVLVTGLLLALGLIVGYCTWNPNAGQGRDAGRQGLPSRPGEPSEHS
ncbi:hypothetical protein Q5P01_008102 [Channa striata]|uniref:Uncharacterized protein n=1 Tax=Channa striata TaxID=64152 RepID=A0AA88N9N7_CHASR|nr:hypothetical protein Q5P01_008102 [Channa striata]